MHLIFCDILFIVYFDIQSQQQIFHAILLDKAVLYAKSSDF